MQSGEIAAALMCAHPSMDFSNGCKSLIKHCIAMIRFRKIGADLDQRAKQRLSSSGEF